MRIPLACKAFFFYDMGGSTRSGSSGVAVALRFEVLLTLVDRRQGRILSLRSDSGMI